MGLNLNMSSGFVINTNLKPTVKHPREEHFQDAKILFTYPSTMSDNDKRSHIGISEGIIQFLSRFYTPTDDKTPAIISSPNYTHVIKVVEPPYIWVILIFFHTNQFMNEEAMFSPDIHPTEVNEIQHFGNIKDSYYHSIVNHLYDMFFLFHGSIEAILITKGKAIFQKIFEQFFLEYIFEYISNTPFDFFTWNFPGFFYCPINKKIYLKTQLMINSLLEKYNFLSDFGLIYNGFLIQYSMEIKTMNLLYSYLIGNSNKRDRKPFKLFGYKEPKKIEEYISYERKTEIEEEIKDIKSHQPKVKANLFGLTGNSLNPLSPFGRLCLTDPHSTSRDGFLLGPLIHNSDLQNSFPPEFDKKLPLYTPTIHLGTNITSKLHIFHWYGIILIFFTNQKLSLNQYIKLYESLRWNCKELVKILSGPVAKVVAIEDLHKFIYFNKNNLAAKYSNSITPEMLTRDLKVVLNNIHWELEGLDETKHFDFWSEKDGNEIIEITRKIENWWVTGWRSCEREIYIILPSTFSTTKVKDEIDKLKYSYFHNIFVI